MIPERAAVALRKAREAVDRAELMAELGNEHGILAAAAYAAISQAHTALARVEIEAWS